MNPNNDKTAIWLEKKFNVPESGKWASETVFSVPVSTSPASKAYPGLIVFECTPLDEVDDEIEKYGYFSHLLFVGTTDVEYQRKYRVLDDCSRLRDVMKLLPEGRHYTPSLLFINWDARPGSDVHSDITDMVCSNIYITSINV